MAETGHTYEDGLVLSQNGRLTLPKLAVYARHKPKGADKASPYKMPKDEAVKENMSLEEELVTKSIFNPLAPSSQSSEAPSLQLCDKPSPGSDAPGPKILPHFSEGPVSIPPFDMSILDIPNKSAMLSPVMDHENALLNLAPGLPVKSVELSGIGCASRGSGRSSGTGSPMSIGSPASTRMGIALRIKARVPTPTQFGNRQSSSEEEEDMDTTAESA